jgi:phage tail sheath protein FI
VYVEEVQAGSRPIEGVGTAVAAFVGFAPQGPMNTPTLVQNWTQYVQRFGDFDTGCYLAQAVYGYFLNGGGSCYVVRLGGGPGAAEVDAGTPYAALGTYRVLARDPGASDLSVEVRPEADDRYRLIVSHRGKPIEEFVGTPTRRGRNSLVEQIRTQSKLIVVEEASTGAPQLAAGTVALRADPPTAGVVRAGDYVGDVANRTGLGGLEAIDEVTMVAIPDLMGAYNSGQLDLESVKAVQLALVAHCELTGNRIAILDPPPGLNAQQVKEWRIELSGYDSKYAALYYPWIKAFNPATGTNEFLPPSGHVAGVWARSDAERGVHKAPANEVVRGALMLENAPTRMEQELLNPVGVNCLRVTPGRGIRVWGARTLSSDPAWRYLNVRRYFNYLEASIVGGTEWVVFEPNDDALWARVRRTISAFLVAEWRRGALFGLTPDEAFYVKCDRETNPAEAIAAGQVVCEIGVAPARPAEFVVFRLAQVAGGASAVTE